MTEPTGRPRRSKAETVLACYVWFCVLATATMEVALISPAIPRGQSGSVDKVDFYLSGAVFQLFWIWTLLFERLDRYDRHKVRSLRRMGLLVQGCFLALLTAGVWHTPHRPNAGFALFLLVLAKLMWRALAATTALHPEDQKVVDEVIEEEERLRAQHCQAEIARLREDRLRDVLGQVRRFTIAKPLPESPTAASPPVDWRIPRGQHAPVVYFIRNGNRIKIGTTTDLHQRVRRLALRMDNVALVLPGGRDVERSTHRQFTSVRVGTSEWFRDEQPLSDFITSHVDRLTTTPLKGSDSHE